MNKPVFTLLKKRFSLLVIALFATTSLFAEDISIGQALQIARKFAKSPSTQQLSRRKAPMAEVTPTLAYTQKSKAGKDNVYVINLGNDQGFVIVSGVSAGEDEVLGYCDHGSFSLFSAPVQLKELLEGYSDIVDKVRDNPVSTTRAPQKASADLGTVMVGPLLTTTWYQWGPYNNLCPEGCPTGCYPTALAQLMKYWNWPKESRGKVKEGDVRVDFSGHVYDWDNMLDSYSTEYTFEQANAVATLMADIGKAFGTTYKPEGSPTNFYYEALIENFGYNLDDQLAIKDYHADKASDLQFQIRSDLDKKRPVLYCGGSTENAHALVCDGYTSKDYFHFNYGWGGIADGYYKNAMCSYGYNAYIFTGIRPYDPAVKVIGDLKYETVKETGTAMIIECMKKGETGDVLDIPATITDEEGITYKVNSIRQLAFYQKGHFDKVTVGENLETVEPFSFMYTKIDTLILNDNLKEVPDESFAYTNVKKLTIGTSVKRIGKGAFRMCNISEVKCKSPAIRVDDEAFWHPNVTFAEGDWFEHITYIGKRAFRAARFPKEPNFAILEEIDSLAFEGATMGNSWASGTFYIPPKLKKIVPNAFNLSNVESYIVDEANPYFANHSYAYVLNKNKTSLYLVSAIKSPIVHNLLAFPETMVKMEPGCVSSRPRSVGTHYYDVEIPATVVEMEGAFCDCEKLGDVTCLAVVPPVITDSTFNDKIFENTPDIELHVPEGTEEMYATAPGWRRFPNIIGDQEYDPAPEISREYYMVVHQNGQDLQDVRMPVKEVTNISMDEAADGQTSLVVKRAGMDNLTTNIMYVDSITWTPGFVFEDGEVFNINDSTLTVEAQKCEVTLGKTVIDGPAQMRIRNSVLTPRVVEDIVRGQAVDVALLTDTGEVHQLSGVARIAISIQRNSDEKVQAAYYNAETGEWDPVLFRYDEEKGAAVILTDHLSLYSVFAVKNDSTRGTILSVYDEFAIHYQTLNDALETLFDIVSSDEPEQKAFQKWKSDVGFWQTIGIDGGYNLISGLGFESEFLGECVNVVGYLGTASTVLDVIGDAIRGNDTGVATNTLKTILGFATGQMASAIGTSIMSASMGVAAFIGVALEKLGTTVHELKKAQLNQAYRYYYTPEGQGAVGNQSVYRGTAYRSPRDWFDYFYPAFEKAKTHDRLMMLIEQAVHMYTERFWEETTDAFTYCMDAVGQRPFFGSTYPYPDEQTRKEISDDYYAELMNNVLPEVFSSIKDKLETKAAKDYHKRQKDYVTVMNTAVAVFLKDSEWEEGKRSKYAGWKVRFTDLPEYMKDKEKWECVLDDKGYGEIGYFSAYTIIKNQMKCNVTLLNPADEEECTYDFTIPRAKGKVHCFVDLATGGVEIEAPRLNLELAYDPDYIDIHLTIAGKGYGIDYYESGAETGIFASGIFWDNARPQTEIEKFFKSHKTITVDDAGHIRIGDDIVGEFVGNEGKGSFTIHTMYPFTERTAEEFKDYFNASNSLIYITKLLLGGSIEHKINCNFTLTRRNSDEYDISYTGEGTYNLCADVVDKVTNVDLDNWPNGLQHVTTEDIHTREINAEGKVTLKYNTVLRK